MSFHQIVKHHIMFHSEFHVMVYTIIHFKLIFPYLSLYSWLWFIPIPQPGAHTHSQQKRGLIQLGHNCSCLHNNVNKTTLFCWLLVDQIKSFLLPAFFIPCRFIISSYIMSCFIQYFMSCIIQYVMFFFLYNTCHVFLQ